jgi:hypothetical protein
MKSKSKGAAFQRIQDMIDGNLEEGESPVKATEKA